MGYAKKNYYSKWQAENLRIVETVVIRIVDVIEYNENKIKTVFECVSQSGKPNLCIAWEKVNFKAGDRLSLMGIMKDKAFVVYKYIKKGSVNVENIKIDGDI